MGVLRRAMAIPPFSPAILLYNPVIPLYNPVIPLCSLLIRLRSLLIRLRSLFIGRCSRCRLLRPVGRPAVLPEHGIWFLRAFWRYFVFWLPISTSGAVWDWLPRW